MKALAGIPRLNGDYRPRTTLACGIASLGEPFKTPNIIEATMPILQKPAKPAKTKAQQQDHSTPYKPPALSVVAKVEPEDPDSCGLTITNDPLPTRRAAPLYKYDSTFDRMSYGQAARVSTANVGKVSGALRQYIVRKGKPAHVISTPRFIDSKGVEDVGFGRVWMVAGASKMPSRRKAA